MKRKFNYRPLRGKIVEKYGSQAAFAEAFGISEVCFSGKMSNKTRFSSDDIVKMCLLLDINQDDIGYYFFTPEVYQNGTTAV